MRRSPCSPLLAGGDESQKKLRAVKSRPTSGKPVRSGCGRIAGSDDRSCGPAWDEAVTVDRRSCGRFRKNSVCAPHFDAPSPGDRASIEAHVGWLGFSRIAFRRGRRRDCADERSGASTTRHEQAEIESRGGISHRAFHPRHLFAVPPCGCGSSVRWRLRSRWRRYHQ